MPKRHPDFHHIVRASIAQGPAPSSAHITDADIGILHVDEQLLVVNKPSGLLAVPGKGPDKADCLITRLQKRWPDALTVHRLDQSTSGVVVFGRGKAAQSFLSKQFEARTIQKRYEAVVDGLPIADHGTIDAPIGDDLAQRPLRHIDPTHGRASISHWAVLARDPATHSTRLSLKPETGRTHQLRVHCAFIGHPIWGDHLYASTDVFAKSTRLMLHAAEIELCHPRRGERVGFEAIW